MAVKIQFRRDTATNWQSVNPILSQGEMGLDTTNNRFKLGDGLTAWNSLAYAVDFQPDGTYPDLRAQATTKDDVGLGNVDNTSDADKPISTLTQQALNTKADASALSSHTSDATIHFEKTDVSKGDVGLGNVDNVQQLPLAQKGQPNGVAELNGDGLVPASQLPSYVDDVLEFADQASFPSENQENGKIYIALDTGKTYRWSGSAYVEISPSLVPNDGTLTVSGGSGLNGTGTFTADQSGNTTITLTHEDTSTQSNVDNSSNDNFIKSMNFDTYGHVTSVTSGSVPTPDVSTEFSAGVIETNNDNNLKFWQGTQAEYDALSATYTKTSGFTSGTTYDSGIIFPDLNSVNLTFTNESGETSTITNGVFSGFGGMTYDDATKTVTINTGDGVGFTLHLAGSSPYTNSLRGYTTGGVPGTFYYHDVGFAITTLTITLEPDPNTLYFITGA